MGTFVKGKKSNIQATLCKEQSRMLKLSDGDIKKGKLISQNQLVKDDLKWLQAMQAASP